MAIFDFKDASLKGDLRWQRVGRFTSLAPPLVLSLAILAIIQIVLGVVFIVSIQSAQNDLTFAQVVQPLIIPGLSFFNTIPSLHLHVLARSNKPMMAMVFSTIMSVLYFASAIIFLPPCVGGNASASGGVFGQAIEDRSYAATECPAGSRRDVWAAMVSLQFLSGLGYAMHFAMALKVHLAGKRLERDQREGRVVVVMDELEKAKREEEARQRWREIRDL